ncbi:hypothetical protein SVIOM74S_02721 [Streptomyces violarus]
MHPPTIWTRLHLRHYVRSGWPWRAALYLLSSAVLGLITLLTLVLLAVAGSVLTVVVVGLPLLLVLVLTGVPLASVERSRLRLIDSEPLADPHREPDRTGLTAWLRTRLQERATWAAGPATGGRRLPDGGRTLLGRDGLPGPAWGRAPTTRVEVDLRENGADLRIDISGPRAPWALELTFRPGGVPEGAAPIGDGRWCLTAGPMTYRVGDDEIRIEADVESGEPLAGPDRSDVLRYDPGRTTPWWAAPMPRPGTASTSVDMARTR